MKNICKKIGAILLAGMLSAPTLAACGGQTYFPSDWTQLPKNTNENLKYFAYFHSDGFNGGEEYFTDIAALNNANVMLINSAFEIAIGVQRLRQVRALGMQAFVTLHGLFSNQQVGKIGSAVLNKNWLATWRTIKANYQEFIDDGTILGFYFDEPYWNGIKEDDFHIVTATVRRECPTLKLMACLTAVEIGARAGNIEQVSPEYHKYCTDLMYDSYINWDDEQRRSFTEKLAAKATKDQYFWACPKGFVDSYEEEGNEQMIKHLKGFYTEAVQNKRFAGIASFSYAGGLDGGDWGYGLNTFFNNDSENVYFDQELRDIYVQIGREVTGRTQSALSAPEITVETQTSVYASGAISVPVATVTDEDSGLAVSVSAYDPEGKLIEVTDGKFTATYGGRYCVAYTVTDSDFNTTKIRKGVFVRDVGEISAFEDGLYLSDVTVGSGYTATMEYSRTYSGSRGSLKVQKTAEENLQLTFNDNLDYTSAFTDISAMIYNPTSYAIDNLEIYVTDGVHTVAAANSLTPKKWTALTITRAYILQQCPAFDFTNATVGIRQGNGEKVATFYVDNVLMH